MKANNLSLNLIIKTWCIGALNFLFTCSVNQSNKKKLTEDMNQQKKKDVQVSLTKAKNATKNIWESIERDVNTTMKSIEVEFNNVKAEIAEILDGSDK